MHIFFNFFFALQFSYPSPTAFYKPNCRTPHPTAYRQKNFTNTTKRPHKYKTSHLRENLHSIENANSKRAFLHHDATMILQKIAIFIVKRHSCKYSVFFQIIKKK